MFHWLHKRKKAPTPATAKPKIHDKNFDVANFVLLLFAGMRAWAEDHNNGVALSTLETHLLSLSLSDQIARQLSGVDPTAVAVSVASGTFPGTPDEIADAVIRMSDNWQRLQSGQTELPLAIREIVLDYKARVTALVGDPKTGEVFAASDQAAN